MNGKRSLVQVALELKARFLDELLVFRIVGNVRQMAGDVGAAHPLQIDVKVAIRAGQQAGRFGRGMLAQRNCQRDGRGDQQTPNQMGSLVVCA